MDGALAGEFDPNDSEEINAKLLDAEEAARDEVWAARCLILRDNEAE
jgi:hypothetical protein